MISRLFPPPIRGKQTSSSKKACRSTANEKSPSNPYPNPEFKHQPSPEQRATGFRAPLQFSSCSLSFLSNKSYFIHWPWLVIQLTHESVLWPVKARTLCTVPQHFTLTCNGYLTVNIKEIQIKIRRYQFLPMDWQNRKSLEI
jgi:hypothetical protein